ncbi:hypothetical protein PA7_48400 [Pseudonocardia asaccharolytica DSM 44247 = NBRC 16224]|uniref:Uncharacterized protein n=1 Tax=Pseudonocardia asaccharolytica DSM 44247 = NBRC 16224 TaxID=1123024 RepID=A0A511D9D0_9PSEU|nr:hypothetical protein PA7_48400 [Pseudonocardia asaccharolytica DSM 44247 = NBRC 16224]
MGNTKIVLVWELALFFLGIAIQLGGVALTIKGARQVWKDVRSPDDRFLAPFIHVCRWLTRHIRRLLRRPGRQVIGIARAESVGLAGYARTSRPSNATSEPGSPNGTQSEGDEPLETRLGARPPARRIEPPPTRRRSALAWAPATAYD